MYDLDTPPDAPALPWDDSEVDWDWVKAGIAEHAADCEAQAAQIVAEQRSACRPPTLREQETRAALAEIAEVAAALLRVLERTA
jgi:hypothetical protein